MLDSNKRLFLIVSNSVLLHYFVFNLYVVIYIVVHYS